MKLILCNMFLICEVLKVELNTKQGCDLTPCTDLPYRGEMAKRGEWSMFKLINIRIGLFFGEVLKKNHLNTKLINVICVL